MTMPDPRLAPQQTVQFPPPNFQGGVPAQVLDPSAPGYGQFQSPYQQPQPEPTGFTGEVEVEEYGDYYGFSQEHVYFLPDGKLWIKFKVFTEGDLAMYHKLLKRDVVVEKTSGDARIKIDQIEERHALLHVAVTGWFMMKKTPTKGWVQQPFSNGRGGTEFDKWMNVANPEIIADLAEAVRKENPFLLGTGADTIEALDKQIDQLQKQRQELVDRQRGEAVSANS
jgi:hypothetical protein